MLEAKGFVKYNDIYSKYFANKYANTVYDIVAAKVCKESQSKFIAKYNERRLHTSKNFKNLYGDKLGVTLSSESGVYVRINKKTNQVNFEKYSFSLIGGIIAD